MNLKRALLGLILCSAGALQAAPKLRLSTTTVGPVLIAQGSNGAAQSIDAGNLGDGTLNLTATSNATWLAATVGAAKSCSNFPTCRPVQLALNTSALAKGTYTGTVLISDPNAVDAPQTVTVTIQVGSGVPDKLDFFLAPNGSPSSVDFTTSSKLTTTVSTQGNIPWLVLSQGSAGSFQTTYPYRVTATPVSGLGEGSYTGSIVTSGSTSAPDNKTVPVTLKVTSQPIAQYSTDTFNFRLATNSQKQTQFLPVSNRGLGTLSFTGATATTTSGGSWLSAAPVPGFSGVSITADPTNIAPGVYQGSVSIASNAANAPFSVPVQLEVLAQGSPAATFGGAVYNGVYQPTDSLAQGAIVALFGEQFNYGAPAGATSLPLGTSLGGTSVFVNDQPAPIFYSSYNQVNFQIPYNATIGDAVIRVDRNGTRGNNISTRIVKSAARILLYGNYGIIVNPDGSLALPVSLGGRPARRGEALVIYAVGLGQTNPPVNSGVGAPGAEPLARVSGINRVVFGGGGGFAGEGISVTPLFVGLSPNFVGLYQINVVVPPDAPSGDTVPLTIAGDDGGSNRVTIAIQ